MATVTTADRTRGLAETSYNADAATLMARAHGYIGICAYRNAENAANVRLRLFRPVGAKRGEARVRRVDDGRKAWLTGRLRDTPSPKALEYAAEASDMEEVTDHWTLGLIRRPNSYQTGTGYRTLAHLFKQLTGGAYNNVVGSGKMLESMHLLFPQWTKIVPSPTDGMVEGYLYGRESSRAHRFRADEVWHDKLSESPFDPYYGYTPFKHVLPQADLSAYITQYWTATFQNEGRPDSLISVEGPLPDTQRQELESRLNSTLRGVWNRGKSLIVGGSFKIKVDPLAWQPKDMGNIEVQREAIKAVLAAMGVPESEVFMNDANLASSNSGHIQYRRQTILPLVNREADFWTRHLLEDMGLKGWWFAPDNPVPKDELSEATRLTTLKSGGIITANEARKELGYGEHDDGDELGTPIPTGTPTAPDEDNAHDRGQDKQPKNEGEASDEVRDASHVVVVRHLAGGEPDRVVHAHAPLLPCAADCECSGKGLESQARRWHGEVVAKTASPYTDPPPESFAGMLLLSFRERRDAIVRAMQTSPHGLMKSGFRHKADDLLARIMEAWQISTEAELWSRMALARTEPLIRDMLAAGSDEGKNRVREVLPNYVNGPAFKLDAGKESEWFERGKASYAERLRGVGETTAEELRQTLREGIREGEALDGLIRRVRDVYDREAGAGSISAYRAEMIARTESAAAQVYGRVDGFAASGVTKKKPLLAPNPCQYCLTWGRQFSEGIPIDQPFYSLGDSIPGTDGGVLNIDFAPVYGGDIHPNDRCDILPVLE